MPSRGTAPRGWRCLFGVVSCKFKMSGAHFRKFEAAGRAVNEILWTMSAWAEDHVRLFQVASALVAIAIGGGGFILGWLLRHRKSLRERQDYRKLVLDQQIVF